jgi:tRNA (mo5U34)-methyltransferase
LLERARERRRLRELVDSVPWWWHSIDLGQGIVTPGHKASAETMAAEFEALRLPDLRGQSVLDVGACDGYHAFECERHGAARVVALDHPMWVAERTPDRVPPGGGPPGEPGGPSGTARRAAPQPGRRAFELVREALGSRVEAVEADFMAADLDALGRFDVVLFLGVLYHLESPFAGLRRLARLTRGLAVIETDAIVVGGHEGLALCEFFEGAERDQDPTNWWAPNEVGLLSMCRAAGFTSVETISSGPVHASEGSLQRLRLLVHARA